MARFEVVTTEQAQDLLEEGYTDPSCMVEDPDDRWYEGYRMYLVDNQQKEVVASDGGEPEDQTFNRDWRWVATLLNKVAAEK